MAVSWPDSEDSNSSGRTHKQLTIAFLGAKSVGKTSLIKRFVNNEFNENIGTTNRPTRYRTSLLSNNRIVELNISDFPAVEKFPEDSLAEWKLHCSSSSSSISSGTTTTSVTTTSKKGSNGQYHSFCRLRQASAYVLVFDAARPGPTFQYIRQIRDQILSYGHDIYKKPIVIAANKHDLVFRPRPAHQSARRAGKGNTMSTPSNEWSCLVRKQWRCCYVECSAKFNWQVVRLFQEVLSAVEGPSVHGSGSDSGRSSLPSGTQQHLLHLPQLAQLAHLGNLNMVQVIPPQPPPPLHPADSRKHTGSVPQSTARSRPRPRRVQCPLC